MLLVVLVLLRGCDGGEDDKCPPWHFTPANATTLCSGCILPKMADLYCSDTGGIIDISFVMTERNDSLFIGQYCLNWTEQNGHCKGVIFSRNYHQTFQTWKTSFAVAAKDKDFFVVNVSQAVGLPFTPAMVYPVNVLATVMEYHSTSCLKLGSPLSSLLCW